MMCVYGDGGSARDYRPSIRVSREYLPFETAWRACATGRERRWRLLKAAERGGQKRIAARIRDNAGDCSVTLASYGCSLRPKYCMMRFT